MSEGNGLQSAGWLQKIIAAVRDKEKRRESAEASCHRPDIVRSALDNLYIKGVARLAKVQDAVVALPTGSYLIRIGQETVRTTVR